MRFRMGFLGLVMALFGTVAQGAGALAVIIANRDYQNYPDVRDAFDATELADELVAAGFELRIIRNMQRADMARQLPLIRAEIGRADRVLVFFSGQVVSSGRDSWLLATDAPRARAMLVGGWGVPIGEVIDMLAQKAGAAVLLVGEAGGAGAARDGLRSGYVARDIAQGVSVFVGRSGALATVVRDGLLVPGTSIAAAAQDAPRGVRVYGYLPSAGTFSPQVASGLARDGLAAELEALIWANALADGTETEISAYRERYPEGRYAREADGLLAALQQSPLELARDGEAALALGHAARRDIQRDLSLLGFDTRGIDGIFGRGSRAAVADWQAASGFGATGYLSGEQIAALADAATARAEELEEEDAIFWRNNGRDGDEAGLRAYVAAYPDGLFSDIALDRLVVFDAEHRDSAEVAEARAWDRAKDIATAQGYTDFLANYPDGAFAPTARDRIAKFQKTQTDRSARDEEQRVLNNPITRLLVERQLAALGYKPGRVDGRIDDATRKAVRKFQRAADLPVSGYVNQATIVRLLAAR